jgi:hypothetical protein
MYSPVCWAVYCPGIGMVAPLQGIEVPKPWYCIVYQF